MTELENMAQNGLLTQREADDIERMAAKIRTAQKVLGRLLSFGERSDLLLDNFDVLLDSEHAHYVVALIEDLFSDLRRTS